MRPYGLQFEQAVQPALIASLRLIVIFDRLSELQPA
jgi:hypothetical protein